MSQAYTTPLVIRAADRDQVISVGAQDTAWHRETPTGLQGFPTWQTRYEGCLALIERLKTAGVQPPPRLALEFED